MTRRSFNQCRALLASSVFAGLVLLSCSISRGTTPDSAKPTSTEVKPRLTIGTFAGSDATSSTSAIGNLQENMTLKKAALVEVPEPSSAMLLAFVGLLALRRPRHG
ncbi:MAG: PEP-CTERM sorting domain-containing protein [Chthoniobacteraceae bacterium]